MDDPGRERQAALQSITDMIARSEKAQAKFTPGTSQHTLQKNRIHALCVAAALMEQESAGCGGMGDYTQEDLAKARAPLDSLMRKSEKARQKLSPGSWQHRMLTNHLGALRVAQSLLVKALGVAGSDQNSKP